MNVNRDKLQSQLKNQMRHFKKLLLFQIQFFIQEDIPIRLAVMFAPSRAWLVGGSQNTVFHRQPRRMHDSLFVVANHGVLLEYILDPLPDSSKISFRVCHIDLQKSTYYLNPIRDRTCFRIAALKSEIKRNNYQYNSIESTKW